MTDTLKDMDSGYLGNEYENLKIPIHDTDNKALIYELLFIQLRKFGESYGC